jgi:outer membrane protein OmpA-like peptidoglycan-associated protein
MMKGVAFSAKEGVMENELVRNLRRLGLVLVMGLLFTIPCRGQVDGPHLTVGPTVGYVDWHDAVNLDNGWHYGGRLGLWLNGYLGIEGHYGLVSTQTLHGGRHWVGESTEAHDQNLALYGGNVIFNISPTKAYSPFVLGGWQEAHYDKNAAWPNETFVNGPQVGAGLFLWPLPRVSLRAEVRDCMWDFQSPPAPASFSEGWWDNFVYSVGVEVALGGWPTRKDADHDGVLDRRDRCPDTPLGARVDNKGCPIDSDNDGVPDGLDQCAATPVGAVVDASGCPKDSDGDQVPDGIDTCPDTPSGIPVDAKGCPTDADGDGVFDGLDKCPNTQVGATVDSYGCPNDSDHDGVLDGLDKCPNTPANARVDVDGCPIVISEKEVELLDTGKITVRNINFDTGKWVIRPESFAVLDEIGRILIQWPDLRIEIGGHTDARGSDKMNQELSEKRANAVREHLLASFPEIHADQYTSAGYGEKQPMADNKTATGMAKNRRVEFKVLNTEVLKKERERRQMLQK